MNLDLEPLPVKTQTVIRKEVMLEFAIDAAEPVAAQLERAVEEHELERVRAAEHLGDGFWIGGNFQRC